jgi:hypothetical protein
VFHHGDPDWYDLLSPPQQTSVHAVLDLLESDDVARFDLPIPMTGFMFAELREVKLARAGRARRPGDNRRYVVKDGAHRREATQSEREMMAAAADGMARQALLKAGWTDKKLDFWFGQQGKA